MKQLNKLKDEVGMAGSKSIQTRFVRDNCIYYTSLRLLFLIITHLLVSMYLLSEVCGRHSGPSCHDGGMVSLIQSHALLLVIFAPLKKQA